MLYSRAKFFKILENHLTTNILKYVVLISLCLVINVLPIFSQAQNIETTKNFGRQHQDLWNGLRQFPGSSSYKVSPNYILATYVGLTIHSREVYGNDGIIVKASLDFLTIEGDRLVISVALRESTWAVFLNELHPEIGRYKDWSPILEVRRHPSGFYYSDFSKMHGRFLEEWDSKDQSKSPKYRYEIYP